MNRLILTSFAWVVLSVLFAASGYAQCKIAVDEVDPFDSTRTVASEAINIGDYIASDYIQDNGEYKMIEQAKIFFTFSQLDSFDVNFLVIGTPERSRPKIFDGVNVFLLLSNGKVVGLNNYPDKGEFDKKINLRVYRHHCLLPKNLYYTLTNETISIIRIQYEGKRIDIPLNKAQQEQVREAIRCVGKQIGRWPIRP